MDLATTDDGTRPAGKPGVCFYCSRPVEDGHADDCVCVKRSVVLKMTARYVVDVPASWSVEQIEFQRNHGTWCVTNDFEALDHAMVEGRPCGCDSTTISFLREATEMDHETLPVLFGAKAEGEK